VGEHSATAKVQGKDSGLSIDNNEIIEPETIIIAPTVRVCASVCGLENGDWLPGVIYMHNMPKQQGDGCGHIRRRQVQGRICEKDV